MTPEELNRTMEFIVASQARLAAAQEQDRQDRVEFGKWARNLTARLADIHKQQAALLVHQSERLDAFNKLHHDWLQQNEDGRKQTDDFQKQALHLLHMILDRLPPAGHQRI
jgi:hypothetical protein